MKKIEVVAAILFEKNKILATQRGYGGYKDKWEFPGGKIEEGESPENALIREIKEELDISISVDEYLCTVDYDYLEFHLTMRCYICSIIEGDIILKEHKAGKWLGASELWEADWLPADEIVVSYIGDMGLLK